jgi:hypothetical protein
MRLPAPTAIREINRKTGASVGPIFSTSLELRGPNNSHMQIYIDILERTVAQYRYEVKTVRSSLFEVKSVMIAKCDICAHGQVNCKITMKKL